MHNQPSTGDERITLRTSFGDRPYSGAEPSLCSVFLGDLGQTAKSLSAPIELHIRADSSGLWLGTVPILPWDGQTATAVPGALMVSVVGEDLNLGWRKQHQVVTAATVGGKWPGAVLARLRKGARAAIRKGETAISAAFDTDDLIADFYADVRRLIAEHVGQVIVDLSPIPIQEASRSCRRREHNYLHSLLGRVFVTLGLQTKGWFEFRGRLDYLQALYEDSQRRPGSMDFRTRLAYLSKTGFSEEGRLRRRSLMGSLGRVPYVGRAFQISPETEEALMLPNRAYEVPDALFEAILGRGGIAEKYPFDARPPIPLQRRLAIDLEAMAHVVDSLRSGTPLIMRERLRWRCRSEIAEFLGTNTELDVLRPEWLQELQNFHVIDAKCGSGEYLVGMLHELVELRYRLCEAFGDGAPQARLLVKDAIERNIRGIESIPANVYLSRIRILNAALTWDGGEHPSERPRIEDSILLGQLAGRGERRRQLPFHEGHKVEFKASFDWSPLRNERDPNLRLGTLRTLCAFLNGEGGVVYLGVADDGKVVGIDDELLRSGHENPSDHFEARIRQFVRDAIDPAPLNGLAIEFEQVGEKMVCVLSVAPQPGVTYLVHRKPNGRVDDDVYVRDGNRTVRLEGRSRDRFVVERSAHVL